MNEAHTVSELIEAALNGDQQAWNDIVDRYIPLVFSITRRYGLNSSEQNDVSQTLWMRLVENLDKIREPAALPGWIAITTRNEAFRMIKDRGRTNSFDPLTPPAFPANTASAGVDEDLLRAERNQMVRDGLAELPAKQRELLLMLAHDPPLAYREISSRLDIPTGSIGPLRARYLEQLKATSPMQQYFGADQCTTDIRGG